MTDSPVQRCTGFLLYSDSINSGINLRKTGLQFKWNCAILLFVGEKVIGQRKLKNSKRECWNWQTGKTKDLVGVCSCGFKSHLPHGFLKSSWQRQELWYNTYVHAEVAELADAHGSGPCGSNTLWVRLPSSASAKAESESSSLFWFPGEEADEAGKLGNSNWHYFICFHGNINF